MKNLAILIAATLISIVGYAQADTTQIEIRKIEIDDNEIRIEGDFRSAKDDDYSDTTRFKFGNKSITIITKSDEDSSKDEVVVVKTDDYRQGRKAQLTWWNGIDLGVNTLMDQDYNFDIAGEFSFLNPRPANSRYISFNFAELKGRIFGDYVGITTGLTIQIYNFKYSGSNIMFPGDSLFAIPSGDRNITKNKLRAEYLGVPLMLEFNTSLDPRKSFHITAGVIGKVRLGNMYKQRFSENDNSNKTSIKGDLGFNRWGLDAHVRVGYGWFTLFGQVGLLPLFDNVNTPDIYTFAAGIAFTIPHE